MADSGSFTGYCHKLSFEQPFPTWPVELCSSLSLGIVLCEDEITLQAPLPNASLQNRSSTVYPGGLHMNELGGSLGGGRCEAVPWVRVHRLRRRSSEGSRQDLPHKETP